MHGAIAFVRRGTARAKLCPGIKIDDGIDDPPAQFPKDRPGSVATMLFKSARRQADMDRRIGRFQEARRRCMRDSVHNDPPVMNRQEWAGWSASEVLLADNGWVGGVAKIEGVKLSPPLSAGRTSTAKQQIAVSVRHHISGFVDHPVCTAALRRALPFCTAHWRTIAVEERRCHLASASTDNFGI